MSKIPTSINTDAFDCGDPATTRIEIYTPGDGHAHSKLDGVTYTCDRHAAELLEVISWDSIGMTPHSVKLPEDTEKKCGTGYDFVAMRPLEPSPTPTDWPGNSPVDRAVYALTFCGALEVSEISRSRAAKLLDCWAGRGELDDETYDAVLDRFPEQVEEEDDPDIDLKPLIVAYDLGKVVGHTQAQKDMELLTRIDAKLMRHKDCDAEKAYDDGYVDALSAVVDGHAFTVRRVNDSDRADFLWECACGEWSHIQSYGDQSPIRDVLLAHVRGPEVTR
jgi:hypothetical protein